MHPRLSQLGRCLLLATAVLTAVWTTGCNTPDPDNASSRPWNSTKSWESGVPGMLYDRR
ncbi:MAG: hypothetical protein ACKODH_16815 [Limisphaerales bacterium]